MQAVNRPSITLRFVGADGTEASHVGAEPEV